MKTLKLTFVLIFFVTGTIFNSCKKDLKELALSTEDEIALGQGLSDEIDADSATYPQLSKADYPEAYEHLERITNTILNTGEVVNKKEFVWQIRIIHDDSVLNAFAAPGGFIYVYTGIIKFLETEHELAGVMGHEIAHADRRHVRDALIFQYGIQTLLNVALGEDQGTLTEIAKGLALLKNSRSHERDADEFSVNYLCPTDYRANGAAEFFRKIGSQGVPTFLSTHPDPGNRVEDIDAKWMEMDCPGDSTFTNRYQDFINSLP